MSSGAQMRVHREVEFPPPIWSNGIGYFTEGEYRLNDDDITVDVHGDVILVGTDRGNVLIDGDGRIIRDSLLQRCGIGAKKEFLVPGKFYLNNGSVATTVQDDFLGLGQKITPDFDLQSAAFLGNSHSDFGHCLTECLSRLWAVDHLNKRSPLILSGLSSNPLLKELITLAGIDLRRFVDLPYGAAVRIEKVYLAKQCIHLFGKYSSKICQIWDRIATNALDGAVAIPADKIYLNRSDARRPLKNSGLICKFYEQNGFRIINPEALSLRQQIATASQSRHIVGVVGSQMHLAQFQQAGRLTIFGHTQFCPVDFACAATAKGQDLDVFVADGNRIGYADVLTAGFSFRDNDLEGYLVASLQT